MSTKVSNMVKYKTVLVGWFGGGIGSQTANIVRETLESVGLFHWSFWVILTSLIGGTLALFSYMVLSAALTFWNQK